MMRSYRAIAGDGKTDIGVFRPLEKEKSIKVLFDIGQNLFSFGGKTEKQI
jgi:hypothetical protein